MSTPPPAGFDTWRAYTIHLLEEGRRHDEVDARAMRDLLLVLLAAVAFLAAAALVGGAS